MENDFKLVRVISALMCEPWLITPEMHKTLTDIALAHARLGDDEKAQHEVAAAMGKAHGNRIFSVSGSTAVIPIEGVIGRKFSNCLESSGVVSIDVAERMLCAADADETIDSIVMIFDSPGGIAMGVPEVGSTISDINERKPVCAFVDGLCCSAAYWLASQCSLICTINSAELGCIGAYLAVLDRSRQAETEGIRVEMFKSGKHKGMGYPGTTLNDEQRAMLQDRISAMGENFKKAVREGRDQEISDEVMQGQSFSVEAALQNGLVDQVTDLGGAIREAQTMAQISRNKGKTK